MILYALMWTGVYVVINPIAVPDASSSQELGIYRTMTACQDAGNRLSTAAFTCEPFDTNAEEPVNCIDMLRAGLLNSCP